MSGLTIWNLSYFPRGFLRDAVIQQHIGYKDYRMLLGSIVPGRRKRVLQKQL